MKIKKNILTLFVLLAVLGGCVFDNTETITDKPETGGEEVIFTLSVPGLKTPKMPDTRALDAVKEKEVTDVDMFVFDNTTNTIAEHYRVASDDISEASDDSDYRFKVESIESSENITIAVIANAPAEVTTALNAVKTGGSYIGALKEDFLLALKVTTSSKWNTSESGYRRIPMYGEAVVTGNIYEIATPTVNLTRMLAKVDVMNNATSFELTAVHVVNYNTAGLVAPNPDATEPNLPSGFNPGTRIWSDGNELTYSPAVGATSVIDDIYIFEAIALSDNPTSPTGLRLVFEGYYTSEGTTVKYYYPVDFTAPRSEGATNYMPVLRNNYYLFTITEALGRGYDRIGDAVAATGVISNLKTSIIVVDMSGINNIVYDGQYYMGTETRSLNIRSNLSSRVEFRVSSDYPGPWSATVIDAEARSWLTLEQSSGTNINGTGLVINVTPVASAMSGRVVFTAGRLCDTLTVNRLTISSMFARSNVVQQGVGSSAKLTFAVTMSDNATIPASSQGVLFKWGSLESLSPPLAFSPAVTVIYNPAGLYLPALTPNLSGWDVLPYTHPNFGSGLNESAGIGDVCQYISSKNWVEGNWRLPTYAELVALYNETTVKTRSNGNFVDNTATLNANSGNTANIVGMYKPVSGWFLGSGVTASTNNTDSPPDGVLFLPASGLRYPNGDGNIVHTGSYGYYWSSTAASTYTINYLFIESGGVSFNDADRSYAFPVRCIRDN